jgi:uncharacterized DUF497 family protein
MNKYIFDWDENKNLINQNKHNVSFEEASTVFEDENSLIEYDEDHSDYEDRFRILGMSHKDNLLIVVYCIRVEDTIRIISSRKATTTERRGYEERSKGL